MKIHQDNTEGSYRIVSHQPDRVQINETIYANSLIVTPDQLIANWPPQTFAELNETHLKVAQELNPEVILLGTGVRQQFPERAMMRPLFQSGIGLEVMDTGSACRTYNILMGEGRRVVAALIISPQ